jgi:hypothetical protein
LSNDSLPGTPNQAACDLAPAVGETAVAIHPAADAGPGRFRILLRSQSRPGSDPQWVEEGRQRARTSRPAARG